MVDLKEDIKAEAKSWVVRHVWPISFTALAALAILVILSVIGILHV